MYIYIYIYIYIYNIYIYIYTRSICRQQLFRCLGAHQYSSDQMNIRKYQNAQTTAVVVGVGNRLWLPFLIYRVLNLTKLRSVIFDQSLDSSCFAPLAYISMDNTSGGLLLNGDSFIYNFEFFVFNKTYF